MVSLLGHPHPGTFSALPPGWSPGRLTSMWALLIELEALEDDGE